MPWSEEFRLAGFYSLLVSPRRRFNNPSRNGPDDRAQARLLMLDTVLWLDFGVRVGSWSPTLATEVLDDLRPTFEGIYDWLRADGRVLPEGPVDDLLRIRGEGLSGRSRQFELSPVSASAAAAHFRNAFTFVGRYTSRREGAFSPLVAAMMFASPERWAEVLSASLAKAL